MHCQKISVVLQFQGESNLCYTNDTTLIVLFAENANIFKL